MPASPLPKQFLSSTNRAMRLPRRELTQRISSVPLFSQCRGLHFSESQHPPLLSIENGTFYRAYPSISEPSHTNPPYFPNLTFFLKTAYQPQRGRPFQRNHWAVISAHHTSTFLDVVRGNLFCDPITARTYPHLSSDAIAAKDSRLRIPQNAIQYVGFNNKNNSLGSSSGITGSYLSARYESHREETDWTVRQYLTGATELNPDTQFATVMRPDNELLQKTITNLRLEKLLELPVANLSNGQTRRARIAKALLSQPELLLLDEPFMGLDPPTLTTLSPMLKSLARKASPMLMLGLRAQDPIPEWITHLVVLGENRNIQAIGLKRRILFKLRRWADMNASMRRNEAGFENEEAREWLNKMAQEYGEPLEGVGETLTSTGVQPFDLYDKVAGEKDKFFDGFLVRKNTLNPKSIESWETANAKPGKDRTSEDWWKLTAYIPDIKSSQDGQDSGVVQAKQAQVSRQPEGKTHSETPRQLGGPLIELESVILRYGSKTVLGHLPPQSGFTNPGLNLTIRRGTRLALLGPNGSGKTTLLSLLTSDHPQSYSLPIKFFGRNRLPSAGVPGLSLWEIQQRIGHSSPEVHAFFPKRMTIRACLENSWAETFGGKPVLDEARRSKVDRMLRWWEKELRQDGSGLATSAELGSSHTFPLDQRDVSWAMDQNQNFGVLPIGTQRLLLLLRAFIKQPDILVLDEAFSGLSAEVRDKAMCFLEHGESHFMREGKTVPNRPHGENVISGLTGQQAMVVVSHIREEIPTSVDEWIRLPGEEEAIELEKPVMMGKVTGHGIRGTEEWNKIWGLGTSDESK